MQITAEFPDKLKFLFTPMRYKVARGGRGSAKSWSVARALLIQGANRPLRILCTREIQKSIQQSVHQLLSDQIKALKLDSFYQVLNNEIRGINGTEFYFSGLSNETSASLKSFEGVDIVWCEEAQNISKQSWDILLPTIRKPDSEIWVTFNPDLETDETYQRFVVNKPDNCISELVNFTDNPWFPDVLEQERKHCEKNQPKDYPNIWEGKCRPAAEGAIYYDEMELAQEEGRICNVPYDPKMLVHVIVDLGWNDAMSIIMCQRNGSELRVIDYIEDSHKKLTDYSQMLRAKPYAYGKMILPHDGYNESVQADSAVKILRDLGWSIPQREELTEMNVENGIKAARMVFNRVYFDKEKTKRLIECLKRYRRTVSTKTGEAGTPLHDEFSHGADAFRYMALAVELMHNQIKQQPINYSRRYIA
jgi:phage terminase large subunit